MIQDIVENGMYITGKGHIEIPIKEIIINKDITQDIDQYIEGLNLGKKILLVSDRNTYKILGEQVCHLINSSFSIRLHVFEGDIKADIQHVEYLIPMCEDIDFVIAVGSGTINDICKLASYRKKIPYIICGTAPSMNGYCSANASISINGFKESIQAHMPYAVYMDSKILAQSPLRMIRSGVGDTLCSATCKLDWKLSHLIWGTDYLNEPFNLIEAEERILVSNMKGVIEQDYEAIEALTRILILSGIGMYIAGGSYPASQAEHMIAHTFSMLKKAQSVPFTFHGEEIAVTTLTMAKIQEELLKVDIVQLSKNSDTGIFRNSFNDVIEKEFIEISKQKQDEFKKIAKIDWIDIKKEIQNTKNHLNYEAIHHCLKIIGAPKAPENLGWNAQDYSQAVVFAPYSRKRFTFLDLEIA